MKRMSFFAISILISVTGMAREAVQPAVAPTIQTNENNQIKQNLERMGGKQNNVAQVAQTASNMFGMAAAACCASTGCDKCSPLVVATVVSGVTSMHNGQKSGASYDYAKDLKASSDIDTTPTPASSSSGMTETQLNNLLKPVKELGYSVDLKKGTVTDPDGKTYSAANLSSAAAMSAAGIDPSFEDDMKKILKEAEKKVTGKKSSDGSMFDEGMSVGGGSGAGAAASPDYAALMMGEKSRGEGLNRDPAQVAGLKTNFNGEPIGVSADSIFGIIERRYDFHKTHGSFIPRK